MACAEQHFADRRERYHSDPEERKGMNLLFAGAE
jgi:hypothetical protein